MVRDMESQVKSPLRAAIYLAPKGFKWKIVGKKSRDRVRRAAWELCQTLGSRRTKFDPDPEKREYVMWKTHGLRFTADTTVDEKMLQAAEKYIPRKFLPLKGKYPKSQNLPSAYVNMTPVGILLSVANSPTEGKIVGPKNSLSPALEEYRTGRKTGRPRKPIKEDIKPAPLDGETAQHPAPPDPNQHFSVTSLEELAQS